MLLIKLPLKNKIQAYLVLQVMDFLKNCFLKYFKTIFLKFYF